MLINKLLKENNLFKNFKYLIEKYGSFIFIIIFINLFEYYIIVDIYKKSTIILGQTL